MPDFCSVFLPRGEEPAYCRARKLQPDCRTFTVHVPTFQETCEGFVTYTLELTTCDRTPPHVPARAPLLRVRGVRGGGQRATREWLCSTLLRGAGRRRGEQGGDVGGRPRLPLGAAGQDVVPRDPEQCPGGTARSAGAVAGGAAAAARPPYLQPAGAARLPHA
ncbi:hypothetical protein ON010_g18366 [Phytophthora cinnamomi]|nr:hypothetical protein ON010_g18366 [Phytophthora cinnamomi]